MRAPSFNPWPRRQTARARLGYLVTDQFLLYGTGGVAFGEVKQTANYVSSFSFGVTQTPSALCTAGIPCFVGSSSQVQTGWAAGVGAEWAVWNHLTINLNIFTLILEATLTDDCHRNIPRFSGAFLFWSSI
jgi:opacity protein-like surface antigen